MIAVYFLYSFYASHEKNDAIIILALLTMPAEIALLPIVNQNWSAYSQGAITVVAGLIQYVCVGLILDVRANKKNEVA